ncbi:Pentatricopeptide repeat-containing protein [Thalictrum thalictroides]|uniref:Pentatricopeptide repeat-containing protein n=1 Tax=Thalictrum thalictroides TaxID=46969 RepID=A0A7J6WHW7_THATH|nr:Pentatricopeptide repeat-containing protein [Thalictrum thalictroides]
MMRRCCYTYYRRTCVSSSKSQFSSTCVSSRYLHYKLNELPCSSNNDDGCYRKEEDSGCGSNKFQQQNYPIVGNVGGRTSNSHMIDNEYYKPQLIPIGCDYPKSPNNEESAGTTTSLYAGTIEELDAFCRDNQVKEAVEILEILERNGVIVDLSRYLLLMKVCGNAGVLPYAKSVHNHFIRSERNDIQVSVYNKILEMYFNCGGVEDAYEVFDKMPERNLTTWDTMIMGLARNGYGEDAIDVFTQFKKLGLRPDGQIFMGVFFACSVLCDVDEGMLHFQSMSNVYGIVPTMEHYRGVVSMLGSVGYLNEAIEFIENAPFEPNINVWETLMNLCRVHGNTVLGDYCTKNVNHLDPTRLTDQSKKGLLPMKVPDLANKEKEKTVSSTFKEVTTKSFEYRAGDTSHPDKDNIYMLLRRMSAQMKEAGYVADTKAVLHDVDLESKEEALLAHSERLAAASGLLNTCSRSPIRIIKNLRVCVDCHSALKFMSKIVGREFIVRDCKRFHHFKDGLCSCKEFW